MNAISPQLSVATLKADELAQVHGGIAEKEGLLPRKFGDSELLVYVDGVLMGSTYGTLYGSVDGSLHDFQGTINDRRYP